MTSHFKHNYVLDHVNVEFPHVPDGLADGADKIIVNLHLDMYCLHWTRSYGFIILDIMFG